MQGSITKNKFREIWNAFHKIGMSEGGGGYALTPVKELLGPQILLRRPPLRPPVFVILWYSKIMENIKIWVGEMPSESYKLLDSGDKKKLEEIGGVKIVRAEPRAWWLPQGGTFGAFPKVPPWEKIIDIGIAGIKAKIKYKNTSKHIGIFPEQFSQWKFINENLLKIENSKLKIRTV